MIVGIGVDIIELDRIIFRLLLGMATPLQKTDFLPSENRPKAPLVSMLADLLPKKLL